MKYLDVILTVWGDWQLFQDLLRTLRAIGDKHGGRSISVIATRWVLDHAFVASVIVGEPQYFKSLIISLLKR